MIRVDSFLWKKLSTSCSSNACYKGGNDDETKVEEEFFSHMRMNNMMFDDLSEFSLDTTIFLDQLRDEFGDEDDDEDDDDDDDEFGEQQIRRLGSWNTLGTFRSIGATTLRGNSICKKGDNKKSKRKRAVRFDYPPISSMKQCPKIDARDMSKLFFSEDELHQIQVDRQLSLSTDEIEVVLVRDNRNQQQQQSSKGMKTMGRKLVNRVQIYVRIRSTGT